VGSREGAMHLSLQTFKRHRKTFFFSSSIAHSARLRLLIKTRYIGLNSLLVLLLLSWPLCLRADICFLNIYGDGDSSDKSDERMTLTGSDDDETVACLLTAVRSRTASR